MQGSAGVGEFLIQLAKDSGNTTYGLLAQNIANRLILIAKPSPLNTGIRIRSQDVVSMTCPNTIPTTAASATNISSSMIYGTWANRSMGNFRNWIRICPIYWKFIEYFKCNI